jgi:hypothetical protein
MPMPMTPLSDNSRLVRDVLLVLYGAPLLIGLIWLFLVGDPNVVVGLLTIVLCLAGFFGSIGWCIRYLPAEVAQVQKTLLALAMLSLLHLFVFLILGVSLMEN